MEGICPKCNLALKNHPKCEACGSFGPGGNLFEGIEYRGHLLCFSCLKTWETYHPNWTWEEFLNPALAGRSAKKEERRNLI